MNNNKHIHDEDYDINIKLMVPLLTVLVCTICLCATTWAWYTASVSTGVTSIKAGVGVQVSATINERRTNLQDGPYTLDSNDVLKLSFSGNGAANGYYALIDISDSPKTAYADPIASLFINRICAEGENSYIIKKCIYFGSNKTQNLTITNGYSEPKQVSIKIVWAEPNKELNTTLYPDYEKVVVETENETLNLVPPRTYVTVNYLDIEGNYLPASTLINDETQNYGLRDNLEDEPAIISFETEGTEFTVVAPEGYLLKKDDTFNEETDVPSRTYQIEPGVEIEIDVICVKIEEEPAESDISEEENQAVDEVIEVPKETEPAEITYQYTVNCIDTDSYTVIKTFTGESVPGEITIDIPLIDGYVTDSNTTVIKVTENIDADVFTVQYKKLYSYEIRYVDENGNNLESVSNQTISNQVEVPLKQFDNKDLILLDGETADTDVRTFTINKELETNVFEIHYTTIVPSENIEPLQEEQLSSN